VARILPGLSERLPSLAPPLWDDPDGDRYRLLEAVASALTGAATAGGAVLVLADWSNTAEPEPGSVPLYSTRSRSPLTRDSGWMS
jgi:hypothetical protein